MDDAICIYPRHLHRICGSAAEFIYKSKIDRLTACVQMHIRFRKRAYNFSSHSCVTGPA